MPYYVRMMRGEDINQVTEIDRKVFPSMWPPPNYKRELENRLAHYIVACEEGKPVEETAKEAFVDKGFASWAYKVRRLFNYDRFFGSSVSGSGNEYIVGFAGFWTMVDEAHIICLAVREEYQRRGIGELLLISVIDLVRELNARLISLEVRASNKAAQSLYRKYNFNQVGLRTGYYTDNREDGVMMTADNIASTSFQQRLKQLKQSYSRKWGVGLCRILR